ncbi:MAG TPA: class I SAM-dependent methyltransferase [Acidimicrobiia bacterium]|nr:class I SAM-dependent methyltransferase [Acidimicrobiia bacterium]
MTAPELGVTYDDAFYQSLDADVSASAATIAPIVVDLLHPTSVLDVGCGRGTWLAAFARLGVNDVLGVDGAHVSARDLEIPPAAFLAHDLTQPLRLGRRFDLVMSLEVAEHLDEQYASAFVESLVTHGAAVLFSAAVPGQGGAGHVNEQWPSTWAARFAEHGYVPVDAVRPKVWTDRRVAYWYAQNVLLFVDGTDAATSAVRAACPSAPALLDVVHPGLLAAVAATRRQPAPPSLTRALRAVPAAARRALRNRMGRDR